MTSVPSFVRMTAMSPCKVNAMTTRKRLQLCCQSLACAVYLRIKLVDFPSCQAIHEYAKLDQRRRLSLAWSDPDSLEKPLSKKQRLQKSTRTEYRILRLSFPAEEFQQKVSSGAIKLVQSQNAFEFNLTVDKFAQPVCDWDTVTIDKVSLMFKCTDECPSGSPALPLLSFYQISSPPLHCRLVSVIFRKAGLPDPPGRNWQLRVYFVNKDTLSHLAWLAVPFSKDAVGLVKHSVDNMPNNWTFYNFKESPLADPCLH